jgi:RNAse (barnase) inhibitor barstar
MRNSRDDFTFVPDVHTFERNENILIAWIPPDIAEKQHLLRALATQLQFPPYFGWNWDALYHLLSDFSWLKTRHIAIVHHDVPLRLEGRGARTYLELLSDAVDVWKTNEGHKLLAVFPTMCRESIQTLLQE